MADEASVVPNHVHLVVPALTPDCPRLETAGVDVTSKDMEDLLNYKNIIGIGELQGFSNAQHVYNHTPEIIDDLLASTAYARSLGQVVDGNAPDVKAVPLDSKGLNVNLLSKEKVGAVYVTPSHP